MDPQLYPVTILGAIWRFAVAAGAGTILGLPTQLKRRPGGVRTHALVSMGATVFVMTALAVASSAPAELMRILQGIASGIGFIGGAAILRGDQVVKGINTAASIWIAAAVGGAIGFIRSPVIGILAAVIAAIINTIFLELDLWMERQTQQRAARTKGSNETN